MGRACETDLRKVSGLVVARFDYAEEYATSKRVEKRQNGWPQRAESRVVAVDYPS
jgi:predicted secreted protein